MPALVRWSYRLRGICCTILGAILISRQVHEEFVIRGKEGGRREARLIEQAVDEGWIRVIEAWLDNQISQFEELDIGGVEIMSLAKSVRASTG